MILPILFLALLGQAPTPEPQLSQAERIAIQALEKQKQAAQQSFGEAQQQEVSIEQEFSRNHPGWHINPMTLAVEKEAPPPARKPNDLPPTSK